MMSKAKILMVDDRPANLIALDGMLSTDGHTLLTAHSGHEALQVVEEEAIDLILLDVQMPDMNGFELAKRLKEQPETAEIPILFASAERLDHGSLMEGFREGAVDYLLKPLDPEITRAKVRVLLELQRRQKLLRQKNAQLEKSALLINNSSDILGVFDAESLMVEEVNPSFYRLLGYRAGEVVGRPFLQFMDESDAEQVREQLAAERDNIAFETPTKSRDGESVWIEWRGVVRNGKWYVNGRDVSEVKSLQEKLQRQLHQLEAANHELESFSYSVSHDLRAPLRALNGSALILEEDYPIPEAAVKYLRRIRENSIRMDTLINELLSFSRIGKKEVRKTSLDMRTMVETILSEMVESQQRTTDVRLSDLPPGDGDYAMIQQVWRNLISNAIKYSAEKENPVVEIGATQRDGGVEYFVRDNGVGFDMAYASKLFGTFQRLHDETEFEGVGIGLAIVQRIVLKHGGDVRAYAEPGKGATFYFWLPPDEHG